MFEELPNTLRYVIQLYSGTERTEDCARLSAETVTFQLWHLIVPNHTLAYNSCGIVWNSGFVGATVKPFSPVLHSM